MGGEYATAARAHLIEWCVLLLLLLLLLMLMIP
jgi:hypothetical protein